MQPRVHMSALRAGVKASLAELVRARGKNWNGCENITLGFAGVI